MTIIRLAAMERAVAAVIAVFAGAIIAGSLQLDTGWSPDTGPQAGYLPLRLGVALVVVSLLIFAQNLRRTDDGHFVTGGQLRLTLAVFLPTVVLVLSMPWLGCYVPTWLYLIGMMRVQGRMALWRAVVMASFIVALFYSVFDLWFQVNLAKGPIEAWLGL